MIKKWDRQVDLIGGPIMKNLFIFMLPILVSYIFQQLYNAVDIAIVGHFLGEQSLAAPVPGILQARVLEWVPWPSLDTHNKWVQN